MYTIQLFQVCLKLIILNGAHDVTESQMVRLAHSHGMADRLF